MGGKDDSASSNGRTSASDAEDVSSILSAGTTTYLASVAQLAERRSEEPGVASSSLAGGTRYFRFV